MTTKQEYNMILNENEKLKDTLQATEIKNKLLNVELKVINQELKEMRKEMSDLENRIDQLESKLFCITY